MCSCCYFFSLLYSRYPRYEKCSINTADERYIRVDVVLSTKKSEVGNRIYKSETNQRCSPALLLFLPVCRTPGGAFLPQPHFSGFTFPFSLPFCFSLRSAFHITRDDGKETPRQGEEGEVEGNKMITVAPNRRFFSPPPPSPGYPPSSSSASDPSEHTQSEVGLKREHTNTHKEKKRPRDTRERGTRAEKAIQQIYRRTTLGKSSTNLQLQPQPQFSPCVYVYLLF